MPKQYFKALYFSDYPSEDSRDKSITVAFSEPETPYYTKIKEMSTPEIKDLIGVQTYLELSDAADQQERSINQVIKRLIKQNLNKIDKNGEFTDRDVTFLNSKQIPFQRWYPYIEGYSPDFVKSVIKESSIGEGSLIYEPFAGTGTTIFAADSLKISTIYSEVNPLLQFLIQVKIDILKSSKDIRQKLANNTRAIARNILERLEECEDNLQLKRSYDLVFGDSKYFPAETFTQVLKLRSYIDNVKLEDELLSNVLSIAAFSCLLPVSFLKKAGDVRFKTPNEMRKDMKVLREVLPKKLADMADDIINFDYKLNIKHEFIIGNAKNISRIKDVTIDAIITSPPYLNGTNYFRNTKLELWFLRYLQHENDLRSFRDQALTSGINDVKKATNKPAKAFISKKSKILKLTLKELLRNNYDSRIPIMAESYFQEIYEVFKDARKFLRPNSKVLIDIGDSIFCGVHIKTDEIIIEILKTLRYKLLDNKTLRKRRSKNKEILTQSLITFEFLGYTEVIADAKRHHWDIEWKGFKENLPHQQLPFSKKNWGHSKHSLCSYQGKLKPAIANSLVKTFVPEGGSLLDPFSGVGTIPFEAALAGKISYGIDISLPAYYISAAKVANPTESQCLKYIESMSTYISNNVCHPDELESARSFGFNKALVEYYEETTFNEVLIARKFIKENFPSNTGEMLVIASLLHILHGNRPYALSRRSHPIVPYAPTGEYIYKNLIEKLREKVLRTLSDELPFEFKPGKIFHQDVTNVWPQEINDLDAIITSPPFFDSTRFYLANWIRIWFAGWSEKDFRYQINSFVEEKQKKDFAIYQTIFRQAKERLKSNGVCVLHLGKSIKCDMADQLVKQSKRWFKCADLFDESVTHCESHGIRDKGTVTSHQYLILT